MSTQMSRKQFEAALLKHGINPERTPMGYYQITGYPQTTGLHVAMPAPLPSKRRAILAHLIKRREDELKTYEINAEMKLELASRVGEKSADDCRFYVYARGVCIHKMEQLTVDEAVALIEALRAVRASKNQRVA